MKKNSRSRYSGTGFGSTLGHGGATCFSPLLGMKEGGIYRFPHLCLGAWRYFGEEHTACFVGVLAIISDWGDLVGRRPHVFWEATPRRAQVLDTRDFRPVDDSR